MEKAKFRVLLVDDYEPWRVFAASTIQKQADLQIIGEATDGAEAVQIAQQLQPDLILLDIGLPQLNGLEAARRIREICPRSRILFLSENHSPDIVEESLSTGATGYVVKSAASSELLSAVEAVLQGKQFISPSLTGTALADQSRQVKHHEIKFFPDYDALVDGFAQFFESALKSGNVVIDIATELLHGSIFRRLRADGLDLDEAAERNRYIPFDILDPHSTSALNEAVNAAAKKGLLIAVG